MSAARKKKTTVPQETMQKDYNFVSEQTPDVNPSKTSDTYMSDDIKMLLLFK